MSTAAKFTSINIKITSIVFRGPPHRRPITHEDDDIIKISPQYTEDHLTGEPDPMKAMTSSPHSPRSTPEDHFTGDPDPVKI